jgi:hypothetical protein
MRVALVSVVLVASCASGRTAAPVVVAPGVPAPSPADEGAGGAAPDVPAPSPEDHDEGEAATGAPEAPPAAAAPMAERMNEVTRLYDLGDLAGARALALQALADDPDNFRMLRVLVSSACILGDAEEAKAYWARLTAASDREQMARRCARFGVDVRAE